VYTKRLKELEE